MKVQNTNATTFQAKMVVNGPQKGNLSKIVKNFERRTSINSVSQNDVATLTPLGDKVISGYKLALNDSLNSSVILTKENFEDINSSESLLNTFVKTFNALKINSKYNEKIGLLKEDKNKLKNITKDSVAFCVNNKKDDGRLPYFSKVKDYAESCLTILGYKLEELQIERQKDLKNISTDKLNFIELFSSSAK